VQIEVPGLHPNQQLVADHPARFKVLRCGRRFGKTILGQERAVTMAAQGFPVAWFAPTYKFIIEVWDDIVRMLAPITSRVSVQERRIELVTRGRAPNGEAMRGLVEFWSLEDPDAGRGRKYSRAIVDECDRAQNLEQAWTAAIRPTLTDLRGDAWFLGTPKGRQYLTTLYARGQSGDPEWMSWNFPTISNPHMDRSEVDGARRDMPPEVFAQEYEGVPAADGGNPFGEDAILDCKGPLGDGPVVAWGVDLAKSVDWTVMIGLNAEGQVCGGGFERFQRPWKETEDRIVELVREPALIDSTGVGDPVVEMIQRRVPNVEGYKFTSPSKQQLMEGLRRAIQRREIQYPEGPILNELLAFGYQYLPSGVRYTAPSGLHDDCVMALALAVHKWAELGYGQVAQSFDFDVMTPPDEKAMEAEIEAEIVLRSAAFADALKARGR
jgi:hypothetical protein